MDKEQPSLSLQSIQTREIYQGPIPHPEILKKFGEVHPSYPERILKMAEDTNAAAIKTGVRGQVFSFILGLSGFGVAALLAFNGLEGGAIAAAIGGVAPIIVAALGNLRK